MKDLVRSWWKPALLAFLTYAGFLTAVLIAKHFIAP